MEEADPGPGQARAMYVSPTITRLDDIKGDGETDPPFPLFRKMNNTESTDLTPVFMRQPM